MTKSFLVAAVAGMVTIAIVGGLLYGVIFAGFIRANIVAIEMMKSPPAVRLDCPIPRTVWHSPGPRSFLAR